MTTNMTKKQIKNVLEKFEQLPFSKKEKVFKAMSERAEKATNDNDGARINRIEKGLTRALVKSWNTSTNKAIRTALGKIPKNEKRFTQKSMDKVLASLEKTYKGVEKRTVKRVKADIKDIYKTEKGRFGRKFKLKQIDKNEKVLTFKTLALANQNKKEKIIDYIKIVKSVDVNNFNIDVCKAVKFGIVDTEAYENLARLENIAVGDHFPKTKKIQVSKAIQTGVLDKGLNNADAGLFLKQEMTSILGGNVNGALPASVAKGQASTNAYFEMLNATNTTYAKNFAHINLSNEAGITQLIFSAILDRTTSQICSQMDGRVFTIEQALVHQSKVLGAENVEGLKTIAPFQRNLSEFKLGAGENLTSPATSKRLADAGVMVPPLHGRCRSSLQPV